MRFSQRSGKVEVRNIIQRDGMDEALKNRLFNITLEILESTYTNQIGLIYVDQIFLTKYSDYFGLKRADLGGKYNELVNHLNFKIYINDDVWFFYDFIEFLISQKFYLYKEYTEKFNRVLEEENLHTELQLMENLFQLLTKLK